MLAEVTKVTLAEVSKVTHGEATGETTAAKVIPTPSNLPEVRASNNHNLFLYPTTIGSTIARADTKRPIIVSTSASSAARKRPSPTTTSSNLCALPLLPSAVPARPS